MQPCAAAVYKWMKLAYEKLNLIQYYVFFNDGDNKPQEDKHIGSTGGIYGIETTNLDTVFATMETAMRNGHGGDGPVNDIEALIFGIQQCPTCTNVILIADNQVSPRDMILLPQVTKPVKVIICQLGTIVNVDLINVAAATNGSIHTLQEDIFTLAEIPVGGTIVIGSHTYQRTATGYVVLY